MKLSPGTPCYIVANVYAPEMIGRVVTVIAGPLGRCPTAYAGEPGEWYEVDAEWLREHCTGPAQAERGSLRPVIPPEPADMTKQNEPARLTDVHVHDSAK